MDSKLTPLRQRILFFVRLCNDLNATVTYGNIIDYVPHQSKNSVSVALNWLRKNGYLIAIGKQRMYRYIISGKGLRLLKTRENKKQINDMEKAMLNIGGF